MAPSWRWVFQQKNVRVRKGRHQQNEGQFFLQDMTRLDLGLVDITQQSVHLFQILVNIFVGAARRSLYTDPTQSQA